MTDSTMKPTRALRYDKGKPDYTYLEKGLRDGVARVMAYGAKKYFRDNWKNSLGTEKHDEYQQSVLRCLLRHAHALADGEEYDKESGESHAAHVATNAMMYLAYQEYRCGESDSISGPPLPVSGVGECTKDGGDDSSVGVEQRGGSGRTGVHRGAGTGNSVPVEWP